jgi:hypothetical protein
VSAAMAGRARTAPAAAAPMPLSTVRRRNMIVPLPGLRFYLVRRVSAA